MLVLGEISEKQILACPTTSVEREGRGVHKREKKPMMDRGEDDRNVPKRMISTIKITTPTIPPPVPYCQAVPLVSASIGAAKPRPARQSWARRAKRIVWIILVVIVGV